jgi:LacI family transcriptional regulator
MSAAVFRTIAKQVGVSPRTVQRILCGELKDTRPTIVQRAQRIRDLAEAMNYRPNLAARATASGRFGCVSFIRPTTSTFSHVASELFDAIERELAAHDLHLVVQRLSDQQLTTDDLPKSLRTVMSDGLLINYTHNIPRAIHDVIERNGIPTIWLNTKLPADCVYPDDVQAGRTATEYLLKRGHRDVAFLLAGERQGHHSETDRETGYRQAMEAAGLKPRVELVPCARHDPVKGRPFDDERFTVLAEWLGRPGRPRAVVTYSAWTAHPLLAAALARQLRVPEDLAIVTIEDRIANEVGRPLPTVCLDLATMGQEAVRLLLQKIAKPRKPLPPLKVPAFLVDAPG